MKMSTVAVMLLTYNHEKYIAQSLKSILMQKGSFTLDIYIFDDFSTDSTIRVIRETLKGEMIPQHMNIHIIETNSNSGYISMLKKIFDLAKTLKEIEFFTILEGDDYWISPERISKHIECMNNKEYVLTANLAMAQNMENEEFRVGNVKQREYTIDEYISDGSALYNFSCSFFRRDVLDRMNDSLFEKAVGGGAVETE